MLGGTFMDEERFDALARGRRARCNRRDALRAFGAVALAAAGIRQFGGSASASPAPTSREPVEHQLPGALVDVSHDTERVAGLGFAAAAIVVAGKLIRDKDGDPDL